MKENSLNELISGLTGSPDMKKGKNTVDKKEEVKNGKSTSVRFCTSADAETLRKIRLIAKLERLQIKEVIDAAFDNAIKSYEKKHGKLETPKESDKHNLF